VVLFHPFTHSNGTTGRICDTLGEKLSFWTVRDGRRGTGRGRRRASCRGRLSPKRELLGVGTDPVSVHVVTRLRRRTTADAGFPSACAHELRADVAEKAPWPRGLPARADTGSAPTDSEIQDRLLPGRLGDAAGTGMGRDLGPLADQRCRPATSCASSGDRGIALWTGWESVGTCFLCRDDMRKSDQRDSS
jgi:hypothetical protein